MTIKITKAELEFTSYSTDYVVSRLCNGTWVIIRDGEHLLDASNETLVTIAKYVLALQKDPS